jgi:hypothetical protein
MNEWVKKSIEIANSPGYLDNLYSVYPMDAGKRRQISEETINKIKSAVKSGDRSNLIKVLLKDLELFPIKDSYIAFLRHHPEAVDTNPETTKRIGDRLLEMGWEEIIKASTQPKETNRQIGPLFRRWLESIGYPLVDEYTFLKHKGPALLHGSDKYLMDFSNRELGTKLKKGLDFLLKIDDKFVAGEAKFLTDFGGHQNAQFNDAMYLLRHRPGKIIKVAVLDGVVWIKGKNKMHSTIKKERGIALSALLLNDFINSLK